MKPQFEKQRNQLLDAENNIRLSLLQEFADIFKCRYKQHWDGLIDAVQQKIDTGLERPIACPYQNVPMPLGDKVEGLIQDLINEGS